MAFLTPLAQEFTKEEVRQFKLFCNDSCPLDCEEHEEDYNNVADITYWSCLSANGFLDRTDWMGPYNHAEEALKAIKDEYEVDDNGDDLTEK